MTIAKITRGRGSNVNKLRDYLHGKGKHNEHEYEGKPGGAVIGGNVGDRGDRKGKSWSEEFEMAQATRPEIKNPTWQMSLRNHEQDRVLSDKEWSDISDSYAKEMGFDGHPYTVVRHDDYGVHVAVSRVNYDGRIWDNGHDYFKANTHSRIVEKEYDLTRAPGRGKGLDLTQGELHRAERTGQIPERVELGDRIRLAREETQGQGRAVFEKNLNAHGVEYRANEAQTGRVSGYSFREAGNEQARWHKGSELGKDLSWKKLEPELTKSKIKDFELER